MIFLAEISETLQIIKDVGGILISLLTLWIAGRAAAAAALAAASSKTNAEKIELNTRLTAEQGDKLTGEIKTVEKSVNGKMAEAMSAAKTAAHAEGVLQERDKNIALSAAREEGAASAVIPVEVVNPPARPVPTVTTP